MHSNTGENLFSCKKRPYLFTAVVYEGNSMDTIGVHYITACVCVYVCVCACVCMFAPVQVHVGMYLFSLSMRVPALRKLQL